MRVRRGSAHRLGATWDGRGVNVAVFSEAADTVQLCLFDHGDSATESVRRVLRLRAAEPVFRRSSFFLQQPVSAAAG